MEEIQSYLKKLLKDKGIEELPDLNISTKEAGLTSLELMYVSVGMKKKFGHLVKIVNNGSMTLQDICDEVYNHTR